MPRISALPAATRAAGEDELPIVDASEASTKKATVDLIMPTGSILDYAGTNAPDGWLLCYGQTLDATANPEYQALYDIIGNTYGGSSNANFVVPDLRGRVIAGQDDMGGTSANRLTGVTGSVNGDNLGGTGGEESHTLSAAEMPAHGMSFSIHGQENGTDIAAMGVTNGSTSGSTIARYGNHPTYTGANSIQSPGWSWGSGAAHNNVQPTIILNKIIKY